MNFAMMSLAIFVRSARSPQTIGVLNCMIAMMLMTSAATIAGWP